MNYSTHEPRDAQEPRAVRPASARAAEALVAVVPRAMRQIRAVARSAVAGLSVPQFRALRYIDRHSGAGLTALADHLGVSLPAASALVGRLVAAGLAARELDPAERRRITIELTDLGRSRSAASSDAVTAWWQERLVDLSVGELERLVDGLGILSAVLAASDQAPASTVVA